jgi:hypothetical protein
MVSFFAVFLLKMLLFDAHVQLQCQETYAVSQQPYMFKLIVMIM